MALLVLGLARGVMADTAGIPGMRKLPVVVAAGLGVVAVMATFLTQAQVREILGLAVAAAQQETGATDKAAQVPLLRKITELVLQAP